jgi:FkbM family methyltransferase
MKTGYVGRKFYGPVKNPLVVWLNSTLQNVSRYPESYCYFGIEGNPMFSDQLGQLERQVMRTYPRPVRRAHFFTTSVVADKDGPTTLYLDTVNAKNNFWGSSLLPTHRDVETSTRNTNTTSTATVEGYTLSTLLQHTVIQEQGAHAIIKMDVEGAEYKVFEESIPTLCNYTRSGVQIDLLIAIHDVEIIGMNSNTQAAMNAYNANKIKALECGVNLFEGDYTKNE